MTEKERFRKFVRNGFRKDEELGIPYHLYCLAHAVLIAVPLRFIVSAVFYAMDLRDLYGTVYAFNMGVIVFLMFELDIDWRIEKNEFLPERVSKLQWVIRILACVLVSGLFFYFHETTVIHQFVK